MRQRSHYNAMYHSVRALPQLGKKRKRQCSQMVNIEEDIVS